MSRATAVLVLAAAALLEAGGDAFIRMALGAKVASVRFGLFLLGGAVLFIYGCIVNTPPWRSGELLGLYVVFFFVFAQLSSWLVFHQRPGPSLILGGVLITAGGAVIALGSRQSPSLPDAHRSNHGKLVRRGAHPSLPRLR